MKTANIKTRRIGDNSIYKVEYAWKRGKETGVETPYLEFDSREDAISYLIDTRKEMKEKPLTWDGHEMTSYKVYEVKLVAEAHA